MSIGIENLDAAIQGIRDVDAAPAIHADVRGKIKFALGFPAPAELENDFPLQIADDDLMPLRIGDDQLFVQKRQTGRPFESVGDGELHFAFFIKGDDFAQGGVGDKKCFPPADRRHRRK